MIRKDTDNTSFNRIRIARKPKSEEKQVYGHFKRQTSEISREKTWKWLRNGCLIREIEVAYSYATCMQKYIQHNKDERTQFFRKIYFWLYLKGFERVTKGIIVWEVSWRLNRIEPHSSGYHCLFFPFSLAAQRVAWGPSLCWDMVLIPASSLQLIWTSCRRGYIIIWHLPTSCESHNFALNSTPRQSRSPLISWYIRPDAPVIYTGAFLLLTAWPGQRSICNNWISSESSTEQYHKG